jgi:shikimate kinase
MAALELPLHSDLNLVVTGYLEPNRPRIARQLGLRLGLEVVDVEREIEDRLGNTVEQMRQLYGERRLKAIETQIMDEIVLHRRALIRVSGNTLLNSGHLAELQRNGVIVCLVASLDSILRRIHLTLGARYHDPVERSRAIGELQREWKIREVENVVEFDATHITETILIERIAAFWRELAIRRG